MTIRIKTINGHDYYYEQESVRVGNTVKTKHVRYIGKFLNPHTAKFVQYHMNEQSEVNGRPLGKYDSETTEETVSTQRFNLDKLKYVGHGRDRVVYETSDGKIVKIAKTPNGLLQNESEVDYSNPLLPKTIEVGKDYVVKEKAERDDKRTAKMLKPFQQYNQRDFDNKTEQLQNTFDDAEQKYNQEFSYALNYNLAYGDFIAKRNWGWKDNKPYHIDGGTFNLQSIEKEMLLMNIKKHGMKF